MRVSGKSCGQTGPNRVADRISRHGVRVTGGINLNDPTGGAAKHVRIRTAPNRATGGNGAVAQDGTACLVEAAAARHQIVVGGMGRGPTLGDGVLVVRPPNSHRGGVDHYSISL